MAKETEIKVKLMENERNFDQIQKLLKEVAIFKSEKTEIDMYFSPKHKSFLKPKYPFKWLRLRKSNGKSKITFKHFYPEYSEKHSHCDEFETTISSFEEMQKILEELNLVEVIKVVKSRSEFSYNDFTILLDDVSDLGLFIEIEQMDGTDHKAIKQKMFHFLDRVLKLKNYQIDYRGYPYLLLNKSNENGLCCS